jgi:hypothetical protein
MPIVTIKDETYHSQAWQDQFVDLLLMSDDGQLKKTGYFVDVGAGTQQEIDSNSIVFERRGWQGIAIDSDPTRLVDRSCICETCFIGDGSNNTVTLSKVLNKNNAPNIIDYLSVDIEGYDLMAVQSLVDNGYTFKVLTIEHNLYCQGSTFKDNIFNYLSSMGYIRIVDNVGDHADIDNLHRRYFFEDWYIDPRVIDYKQSISRLKTRHQIWGNRNASLA